MLSPVLVLFVIAVYFLLLYGISLLTKGQEDNKTFFTAKRQSPWFVVAFGMIGASLSGVTFISIPGVVGAQGANQAFSYMQMVLGYVMGYAFIALVLLPIYYRMNLTSIYEYLEDRFGWESYKTGASFFLLSRSIGASLRLYLVAIVLDIFVFAPMGMPFWVTVAGTILLIWIYTFRGGIKTIVWTDTLQTSFMILAVLLTVFAISNAMQLGTFGWVSAIRESDYSQWFFFEQGWGDANNFFKQFLAGALITIVMTGLDQDMMQKNLTCRNLKDAQKNMFTFSIILVFVNMLFLSLGALLYLYAEYLGITIPGKTDQLYPTIAFSHLSPFIGLVFLIGLVAAAYSTADSALTSLTTSFCVDFLNVEKRTDISEEQQKRYRLWVHMAFSVILLLLILVFHAINDDAVINKLFKWAGLTYGPILGLFAFGITTGRSIKGKWIFFIAVIAPLLTYYLDANDLFIGFKLGFLNLLLNGILMYLGLFLISNSTDSTTHETL